MKATFEIRSRSRANDSSLIALSDLSAAASSAGLRHRVIGGQMVDLLLHHNGFHGQVIDRATAEADVGVGQFGPDDFAESVSLYDTVAHLRRGFRTAASDGVRLVYDDPRLRAELAVMCVAVVG